MLIFCLVVIGATGYIENKMWTRKTICSFVAIWLAWSSFAAATHGPIVLYEFNETKGDVVKDTSRHASPLNLRIKDPKSVDRKPGSLRIRTRTIVQSDGPATKIIQAIKRTGETTIEAWITPENDSQSGPARIVTLSKDSNNRNFTLGQDRNKYVVRYRSRKTSTNGIPSTDTKSKVVKTKLTHLVYTRMKSGSTTIYVNGKLAAKRSAGGDIKHWDSSYQFALGDELVGGRLWKGTFHLVAVYDRDLSAREIQQHYRAGAKFKHADQSARVATSPNRILFETKVAPLLANHCLECHDESTRNGGLSLARKKSALAGGDSGVAFLPGKPDESSLWLSVREDDMPHDRPPLSSEQKQTLKSWIAGGGEWTIDFLDPAIYSHGHRPNENWIRRLTVPEYIETVRTTFNVDVQSEARKLLPTDARADGFSNTAYNLNVDLQHVEAYATMANVIVDKLDVIAFAKRFQKRLSLTDKDMRGLIEVMGKWVLRGPLEERETVLYRGITTSVASDGGDVKQAIGNVLSAMIQSPRFLYRIENQDVGDDPRSVDEYELASRISYIVWGCSPDKELYQAAESGELTDSRKLSKQLERMFKDPRAVKQSLEFVSQWLDLDRLGNMQPNAKRFPNWTDELGEDMRRETLAFAEHVLWNERLPLVALLNHQTTFLTPQLARHYGLPTKGDGIERHDLRNVPARGGLMTQGSVLTVGGDDASMVTRGLLVMHELLRGVVKDPPPCVDTTPVPSEPGLSQRAIAEARISDESCGGCHGKFEPLAFGLEKFDGLGAFHEKDEYGNRLREDGEVLIPGDARPSIYKTSSELMDLLAASDRVKESLTWKLTQFALGRPLTAMDAREVLEIHEAAKNDGGTYQAIVSAIVQSDLVQMYSAASE